MCIVKQCLTQASLKVLKSAEPTNLDFLVVIQQHKVPDFGKAYDHWQFSSISDIPFSQVVLAANSLPAINDITAAELRILIQKASLLDPILKVCTDSSPANRTKRFKSCSPAILNHCVEVNPSPPFTLEP